MLDEKARSLARRALFGTSFAFIVGLLFLYLIPDILLAIASRPLIPAQPRIPGAIFSAEVPVTFGETLFISAGRPRGTCELHTDGGQSTSNRSMLNGLRDQLMVSTSRQISESPLTRISLDITCEHQKGFSAGLTERPHVTSRTFGLILESLYLFYHLGLAPSALLLLAFTVYLHPRGHWQPHGGQSTRIALLLFSAVSFAYIFSLAHVPRLFVSPEGATKLHIVVRALFATLVLEITGRFYRRPTLLLCKQLLVFLLFLLWPLSHLSQLKYLYELSLYSSAIVSAIFAYQIGRAALFQKSLRIISSMLWAWSIFQVADSLLLFTLGTGRNFGPVITTGVVAAIAWVVRIDISTRDRQEDLRRTLMSLLDHTQNTRETLVRVSRVLHESFGLARVSTYIDGACTGFSDTPRASFVRIFEAGYLKNTERDSVIRREEATQGPLIPTIDRDSPVIGKGRERDSWYMLIPVGKHACITLSDTAINSIDRLEHGSALLETAHQTLKLLAQPLVDAATRPTYFGLYTLRSRLGNGKSLVPTISLFADICDYSAHCERFGESFSDFVRTSYFPALWKLLHPISHPDYFRGDEILVHCFNLEEAQDVLPLCEFIHTLTVFSEFVRRSGAQLCADNGFPALQLTAGASGGVEPLTIDPFHVSVGGSSIIEARRTAAAAAPGQILVAPSLAGLLERSSAETSLGPKIPIQVKKDLIIVREVFLNALGRDSNRVA